MSRTTTITLRHLAEKTGVSATAISHVLNGRLGTIRVSDETRRRVQAAADELGYVPQASARSMATRKSYSVAVVCTYQDGPMNPTTATYFANALTAAQEVCKLVGYHCLYATCGLGNPDSFVIPRFMKDGSVDGILLAGHADIGVIRRIKALDLPCVQVGSNIDPAAGIPCVYADFDAGIADAARHLVSLGHRRVELLLTSGPGPAAQVRNFLSLASQVPDLEPTAYCIPQEWGNFDQGVDRAKHLLAARTTDSPTAYICTPHHAAAIAATFAEAGLLPPRDYSLVVMQPAETGPQPLHPLGLLPTAIDFPLHQVARHAAAKLFSLLDVDPAPLGPPAAGPLPATLTPGQTTGPAPQPSHRTTAPTRRSRNNRPPRKQS
jgi:DNA-binding LacI/PurR family transcriptional regulator